MTVTTGAPNTSSGCASAADVRCTLPDAVIVDEPPSRITCETGLGGAANRAGVPLQLSGATATGSASSSVGPVPRR